MAAVSTLDLSPGAACLARGDLRPDGPAAGDDLVRMGVGEPDFATPEPIVTAGIAAWRDGWTHYGDLNGDPELRSLAARLATTSAGARYDVDQVLVCNGATSAVTVAISTIVSPGDRVVLLDPSYSLFASAVLAAGGIPIYVPLDDKGHLDLDRLEQALVGARAVVVVNPANPVGTVYRHDELTRLADLCVCTGTTVIADEVCDHFVFDGRRFTSCLQIDAWRDQLIYVQSLSKTYAMTGWRVGYLIAPRRLVGEIRRMHRTYVGAVTAATQRAAITALSIGDPLVAPMRESYQQRRDLVIDRIAAIPGLSARSPEGGFFVMARYDARVASVDAVTELTDHGVVVRPGREFGPAGEYQLRLCLAVNELELERGLDRIARWAAGRVGAAAGTRT